MTSTKPVLLAVTFVSLSLLGVGLYLQHVEKMQPCPWCVIQRYAFAAVAFISLIASIVPACAARVGASLASVTALAGAGAAAWHVWIKAHPGTACGIDPLETSLNTLPSAKFLPFLFQADGLCTTDYPPIFGLSIPQWACAWFVVFAIALGWAACKRTARRD